MAAANAAGPQVAEAEVGGSAPCEDPLLRTVFGRSLDLRPPYRAETMVDLVREYTGVDARASWDRMHQVAAEIGVEVAPDLGPGAVLHDSTSSASKPSCGIRPSCSTTRPR